MAHNSHELIYKIVPMDTWQQAEAEGVFKGAGVDIADGFIHFSTSELVRGTAARFFKGVSNLALVAVQVAPLASKIRWEKSGSGGIYPHLYEPLDLGFVAWSKPLPMSDSGEHDFTGLLA